MNFIGKIFVVFIFIMSIVFMTLAAVVYSTHKNWEAVAKKAQGDYTQAQTERQRLENEYNRSKGQLESQREAAQQQVRKLESERDVLEGRTKTFQEEVDSLRDQVAESAAALERTQTGINNTTDENKELRNDNRVAMENTDKAYNKALAATDLLHQVQRELEVAAEARQDLLEDVGRMTAVMRSNDIDPSTSVNDVTPRVDGFVQAVARQGSQLYIQVSIGTDDGLKRGHYIEVFRGTKYLGKAKILKSDPDKAIGLVDPRYQEGRIQEADRVATRLNLG